MPAPVRYATEGDGLVRDPFHARLRTLAADAEALRRRVDWDVGRLTAGRNPRRVEAWAAVERVGGARTARQFRLSSAL